MTDEERIDEIIRNAAADYNRPPPTPKDEMWTAILSAQQGAGPRLHVTAAGASRSASQEGYKASRRFSRRVVWMSMAAAAVLLVAAGVGIGRLSNRSGLTTAEQQIAEQSSPMPVAPANEASPSVVAPEGEPANTEKAPHVEQRPAPKGRSLEEIRRNPRVVGIKPVNPVVNDNQANVTRALPVNGSYQLATQRHLADAEALLTSFSLGTRDARMDAQFAMWAKGLLSNTRLLLDSPAGDDPRRAKLLQDLELVLAQIVQLSPNAQAQDRELIQGSIQAGHVMSRLRTAIPAGQPGETTER